MTRMEKYRELREKIKKESYDLERQLEASTVKEATIDNLLEESRKVRSVRCKD